MLEDMRKALRQWRKAPAVTVIAVLSLTLGIGGTLALFSLVDALLLKTLPVYEPERLTRIVGRDLRPGEQHDIGLPTHIWEYLRDTQTMFESVLAVGTGRVNLARGGETRYAGTAFVDAGYFDTLGLRPAVGRPLRPYDEIPTNSTVAVISHSLWLREYGERSDIVGQPIYLDNHRFDIVGVAPKGFFGLEVGRVDDVIVPLAAQDILHGAESPLRRPTAGWLQIYPRLRPGQSFADTAEVLRTWYPALRAATARADVPDVRHLPYQLDLAPAAHGRSFVRQQYATAMSWLLGAVTVLLLIACTNVAVLAMARFSDRRHEIGIRLSLGATRTRIVRMLLTDSLLLALVSGALGVGVGYALATFVAPHLTFGPAGALNTQLVITLDGRTLAIALLLTLLSAGISGLVPAIRNTRVAPLESLSQQARCGSDGRQTLRTMRALATSQVACSVLLLVGASLLVRSFVELTTRPAGIDRDRVLVAVITDPFESRTPAGSLQRITRLQGALATTPGVAGVSAGIITPLGGMMAAAALRVPGSLEITPTGAFPPFNSVLPGYFDVLGTPLLMGRDFTPMDVAGGPIGRRHAAIVNQAFAERHFGGFSPLGRVLMLGDRELQIVGVVANARAMSLREDRPVPMAYGALAERANLQSSNLRFVIRAENPEKVRAGVLSSIRAVDPRIVVDLRTMSDDALMTVNRERLLAWLGGSFALLGLLITVGGVYGTFAYAVVRRRVETGVRLALGATRADVLRLFLGQAALVVVAGVTVGTAAALAGGQYAQSVLFGVSPRDGTSVAVAVASMFAVAAIATYVPARRAASVQPAEALRAE
ncbi:MAG TPA: ADOP family duplicated permease [Vicinamibacterales bacterium]|nr:ADOP family duplicated permease [Vicinamibacterales bacterium]